MNSAPTLVVFTVEGQRYAFPLDVVDRVLPMVEIAPVPDAPGIVLGVVNVHGNIVPILDVRARFHLSPRAPDLASRLLVIRTASRVLGVPADEVLGVRTLAADAIASPEGILPGLGQVAGIARLHDGVLLIHDPDTFLSVEEDMRLAHALAEAER
jgi:purine-binding chemotaxis protein CheW